jgi:hypothetical protein
MTKKQTFTALGIMVLFGMGGVGCASKAGNVALGAGAAGTAYELENKHELNQLDKDLQEGKISQDEHDRRAQEIKNRSLLNK